MRPTVATDPCSWLSIGVLVVLALASVSGWVIALVASLAIVIIARRGASRDGVAVRKIQSVESDSRDASAKARRELKLLEAESRLGASALLQLIDGVVVLSNELSILLINPSAVRLLGLEGRENLLGRSISDWVRQPKLTRLISLAISERQPQESVLEFHRGNGILPLRIRADVIDDGESVKVQLSLRDETEARKLEGMRREFIANVSHELKTPLAAIKGYAETVQLAAADDPDMAIHFMNSITAQCLRLERLVADMMQLARAQSGRAQMNIASISLRDSVVESVRTYGPVAQASGLELTFHDDGNSAKVLADTEAALTIANNLIGNAIRYTPRGGRIDVRLEQDSDRWRLVVADTGVGIAEKDQTKIFERFYRGSRSAEMATSSTGLGLAIVKNLSIAMGGSVRVDSVPGEGSTFIVELPSVLLQGEGGIDPITPGIPHISTESLVS
ncbi:two-component system phosphate regulon sensor histidine kinase PhoR [Rhodopirellula rubra]|uniref:histidine kinase n=1 Tax=Aporhodopirellula rubra TaxID=980271 RepID=A0A7W5H6T4_9BACT|nr:ATP-binding protein [Aporhodopirellula rubra]MBB3207653.1 two-component system phosphate regulon sensor histidine kinase PhoR [Aporhodopirellula rubra]